MNHKLDTQESKMIARDFNFTYLCVAHKIEVSRDGYNFFVLHKKGNYFTIHYDTETRKYLIETIIMDIKSFETKEIRVYKKQTQDDVMHLIEKFFKVSVYSLL